MTFDRFCITLAIGFSYTTSCGLFHLRRRRDVTLHLVHALRGCAIVTVKHYRNKSLDEFAVLRLELGGSLTVESQNLYLVGRGWAYVEPSSGAPTLSLKLPCGALSEGTVAAE